MIALGSVHEHVEVPAVEPYGHDAQNGTVYDRHWYPTPVVSNSNIPVAHEHVVVVPVVDAVP
jgi:hypothetical protein